MALNFPSSPSVGDIHFDETAGFYYEWDGTVWKSYSPSSTSEIKVLDDISSSFNGVLTSFALQVDGSSITPVNPQSLIINLGGVIQSAATDYALDGSNLTFTTAPQAGLTFSGVSLGPAINNVVTKLTTTADNTSNEEYYPVLVNATSQADPKIATNKLKFNPLSGIVSATGFVATGVVTATAFHGNINASNLNTGTIPDGRFPATLPAVDGSNLTNVGVSVSDDTTTNSTFYPLFTTTTSGTVSSTNVSTTKLSFNPSTGKLTATAVNSSSDEKLKTDIETVASALDTVKKLRGVDFAWKDSGEKAKGVIAQELNDVLPELVSESPDGTLSVNYNGIIAVLIEAIKELSER